MSIDEQHVALPKLYGAPAYARPPRAYDGQDRPLDPDDLPLEAERTDEDVERWMTAALAAETLAAEASQGNGNGRAGPSGGMTRIEGRPFTLRSLGRILNGRP